MKRGNKNGEERQTKKCRHKNKQRKMEQKDKQRKIERTKSKKLKETEIKLTERQKDRYEYEKEICKERERKTINK